MIHPQAYLISAVFTAGKSNYQDFDLCEFNNEEAALYFFVYWLVWPILILVYLPMAVLLSPIYVIGLSFYVLEQFIEFAENGEEVNKHVEEADANSDEWVEVEWRWNHWFYNFFSSNFTT